MTTEYQEHAGAVSTTSPVSLNVGYSYASGSSNTVRRMAITYPSSQSCNYVYSTGTDDTLSRVSSIQDGGTLTRAVYSYLGAGAVVTVDYTQPQVKYNLATGSTSSTRYAGLDAFNRTVTAYWQNYNTSADVVKIGYTYDRVGNRLTREDFVSKAQSTPVYMDEKYAYDGLHRLIDLTRGTLSSGSITSANFRQNWMTPVSSVDVPALDPTGNWNRFRQDNSNGGSSWSLDQTRGHNQANEITSISGGSWPAPTYDDVGNALTFPQPAALTSSYTATYDAWNRLVKLTASSTNVAAYAYDGLNRRVVKKKYTSGTLSETRHFYYSDAWQVLEERVDSHPTIPERQFFWGVRYVDDLASRDRDSNFDGTIDDRRYALQDDNWNMMTFCDTSGGIYERFRYDAYGVPTLLDSVFALKTTADVTEWETLYASYRWDSDTGLYQVRNRYLHPDLGRWVTRDPIAAGTNLYASCANNPLKCVDPFGLAGEDIKFIDYLVKKYNLSPEGRNALHSALQDLKGAGGKASKSAAEAEAAAIKGLGGKFIKGGGAALGVIAVWLSLENTASAAEISPPPPSTERCPCECARFQQPVIIPSWWAIFDEVEWGPSARVSKWVRVGCFMAADCYALSDVIDVEETSVTGFTIYNVLRLDCRFVPGADCCDD